MTTQTNKVRLVRCPKCMHLLAEPDIPVYLCGGCGTALQAKNRRTDSKGAGLDDDGSYVNGKREVDSIPDVREINGQSEEADFSVGGESSSPYTVVNENQVNCLSHGKSISTGVVSSPDATNQTNENNSWDCNGKQPGSKNISSGLPSLGDEDLTSEITEQMERVRCEYNADQNMQEYENEFGDSDRNRSRGRSMSEDFYSSMEFPCLETEDSSPEVEANLARDETKTSSNQWARVDRIGSERKKHEDRNFFSEVSSSVEGKKRDENDFSSRGGTIEQVGDTLCMSQIVGTSNACEFEGHSEEVPQNANSTREISSSTENAPVMPSPVVNANTEVDEDSRVHNFGLEVEDILLRKETDSVDAGENPMDGSVLSDIVDSSDDQHLGNSERLILQEFGQSSATDTPDNLPLGSSGSQFGLKRLALVKSPTRSYYEHDGNASSFDGFEEHLPGRPTRPPRRKGKQAIFSNSNGLHREDVYRANDSPSDNLEMQYQAILGSSLNDMLTDESEIRQQARKSIMLPEKNQPTMKYRSNQDDLHEPRSFSRSIGGRKREDKEEDISRLGFIAIRPQTGQRRASPPPYSFNTFPNYSGFCSSDASPYAEHDKMELLRMVNELKDEVNRLHISNSRSSREEKYIPHYYDHHMAPVGEISSDLCYSRYPHRCSQEKRLAQLNQLPRMPFSVEVAHNRRHVDHACLHCHSQDWHYSAQLPSHMVCCNKVPCLGHGHTYYNGPCSVSSSPRRYKSSELSAWDHDTMSSEQRHRDHAMKSLDLRERYQSMKRHVRPVAGATPIVACYHCSELIQLPADFLLLGKRCHKLRCNACRKVLMFSLESSKHLVPFIPDAAAMPPPSMVDDHSGSFHQGDPVSLPHSNDHPYAEPLSSTDDYGISFERSFSTTEEGGPSSEITPPLHPIPRNSGARNASSGDCVKNVEDRKKKSVMMEHTEKLTKSKENLGSVGTSSKKSKGRKSSSEIKELPTNGGSPLHRLMGYSSPSSVIKN